MEEFHSQISMKLSNRQVNANSNEPAIPISLLQEPLMMEAFGSCLPTTKEGKAFVNKILDTKPSSSLLFTQ